MAVKYDKDKGPYKTCNCGGPLPTYELVYFRFGSGSFMPEAQFTQMIRTRRTEEREYSGDALVEWKARTDELRNERRVIMQSAQRMGFSAEGTYFTDKETAEHMLKNGEITVIEESEYDTMHGITMKEHKPRPDKRRY